MLFGIFRSDAGVCLPYVVWQVAAFRMLVVFLAGCAAGDVFGGSGRFFGLLGAIIFLLFLLPRW